MKKVILAGLVVQVMLVLGAIAGVWALGSGEEAPQKDIQSNQAADQPQGRVASVGITGIVEYTVRDPSGNVKEHGVIENTINAEALNEVFNRITGAASGGAYVGIAALDVPDDPSGGVAGASMTKKLDGDSGTAGNQNPADGAVTTDFGTETGNGTVSVTFTATGDNVSVLQVVLTKSVENDTLAGNLSIADADIFAFQDLPDVTLNTNDTVQYTWTVDVD